MATNQLAKYDVPQPIQQALDQVTADLKELLGAPEIRDRFLSVVMSQIRTSPELQQADPGSILDAIFRMARLRLDPSLPNEAFLSAFKGEAQLIIGYAGLRKLVMNNPMVEDVWCQAVHEHDVYEEQNINEPPIHRRPPNFKPRGKPIGYYAVARLKNGSHRFVAMSVEEIEAHKNKYSRNAQKSIWINNFHGMALKTVLRQLCHPRELPMDYETHAILEGEEALYAMTPRQIAEAAQQSRLMAPQRFTAAEAMGNMGWGDKPPQVYRHPALNEAPAQHEIEPDIPEYPEDVMQTAADIERLCDQIMQADADAKGKPRTRTARLLLKLVFGDVCNSRDKIPQAIADENGMANAGFFSQCAARMMNEGIPARNEADPDKWRQAVESWVVEEQRTLETSALEG